MLPIKDFINALNNMQNDRMLMSYGNNQSVIGGILAVASTIDQIATAVRSDRINDPFTFNMSNEFTRAEQMVVELGIQRLAGNGINVGNMVSGGMYMGQNNMGMYNPYANMGMQPMYGGNMMPDGGFGMQGGFAPPPMQAAYQPMPQQQPQQSYAPPAAPPAANQNIPQPAAQQRTGSSLDAPIQPNASAGSYGGGATSGAAFNLPGMGSGGPDKAAGRDYLLKLLEDKEK